MPHKEWFDPKGGIHAGETLATVDAVDVIDCGSCGYSHVVPLPDDDRLKEFYEEEFYQSEKTDYLSMDEDELSWLALDFSSRYNFVESVLGLNRRTVLDIGCGPGDFLDAGVKKGWQVKGIEPAPMAVKHCKSRKLDVDQGFFSSDTAKKLHMVDFIHMSEVLEHVADPKMVLTEAEGLLKPGGIICVSVPNDFNMLQNACLKQGNHDEWWVVPDHHLNYFNFDSLETLLSNRGFKVINKTTSFPMELFLLMGQDYTENPALGKKLHGWRKSLDRSLDNAGSGLRDRFYGALAEANLGRLAIVYAQKNSDIEKGGTV